MNIGCIGGSDGPTCIFVSGTVDLWLFAAAALLLLVLLVLYMNKRKNRRTKV